MRVCCTTPAQARHRGDAAWMKRPRVALRSTRTGASLARSAAPVDAATQEASCSSTKHVRPTPVPASRRATVAAPEATRLRDLSPQQWKSGIAAWLGWLFDGLDMHLYTLVAAPFVAELLGVDEHADPARRARTARGSRRRSWSAGRSAAAFFGRVGDRLGRSRALVLTILTYALFTGLSSFAQTWWHLLIFRFLAALGIGGEWAVGRVAAVGDLAAALAARGWPPCCRPASTSASCSRGLAVFLLAGCRRARVFLVGVLPALLVFWIRRHVPEPEEWQRGRAQAARRRAAASRDLFRGDVPPITLLTTIVVRARAHRRSGPSCSGSRSTCATCRDAGATGRARDRRGSSAGVVLRR